MIITLCYIEKDENPGECLLREITEEIGLIANLYDFRGTVIFNFIKISIIYKKIIDFSL